VQTASTKANRTVGYREKRKLAGDFAADFPAAFGPIREASSQDCRKPNLAGLNQLQRRRDPFRSHPYSFPDGIVNFTKKRLWRSFNADEIMLGFQHGSDARRFWDAMRERLWEFSLTLHPEKTRLIMFGRYAAQQRAERGLGKPETFNFLGFTFICGSRNKVSSCSAGNRDEVVCRRSSRMHCDSDGISLFQNKGSGCGKLRAVSSLITLCR
jgi:hypothetical protein